MFNLISGALPLTSGDVLLRGASIAGNEPFEIARRGIGRTFQHVKLVPRMTVLDNVALGAFVRGSAGVFRSALRFDRDEEKRSRAEAARAIARVGLAEHMNAPAGSLALGKQRIVEIARALASDPALLLPDEPAAGLRFLESGSSPRCRQLRSEGMTVLLVEHDGFRHGPHRSPRGHGLPGGSPKAPADIQRDPVVPRHTSAACERR
jgi:branched-chain amino acid transport system permease protein